MLRLTLLTVFALACSSPADVADATDVPDDDQVQSACDSVVAQGYAEESHAKAGDLAYDYVFDDAVVRRLDIVICPDDFAAMQQEVQALYGGGGGRPGETTDDPSYVPVHIQYEGRSWPMVGMRYKGNSSLRDAVREGNGKRPFRLHFDKYEDSFDEVDNQRFWGFKELKFGSAFKDESLIREKLASETYRDAGIPAAKGAFVRVHIDVGDGPVYWGLYTMFEDPTNSLLDDWFGSDSGNCYKPEGTGAYLATFDEASMGKCSNEEEADYSDVQELIRVLSDRPERGQAWRDELRTVLAADAYMSTLAMGGLLANWDSYGVAAHNYYLYADPGDADRLAWIPWDFNEAYRTDGPRKPLSIALDEVDGRWPLIRNTMDDDELSGVYYASLESHLEVAFARDVQVERAVAYHDLVAPWVIGENGENAGYTYLNSDSEFEGSVEGLTAQIEASRAEAQGAIAAR